MRVISQGPARRLGAAMLPVPAALGGAYQSRGVVHGAPGTEPVAAPWAQAVPQSWNRALSRSSDAAPLIRPALYYERGVPEHAPVSVYSDNQMPLPAVDPRGRPAVMARRPVFLGQQQVRQPKVVTRFASRAGRRG